MLSRIRLPPLPAAKAWRHEVRSAKCLDMIPAKGAVERVKPVRKLRPSWLSVRKDRSALRLR
eukprot:1367094-Prymnesium_polylepis.1